MGESISKIKMVIILFILSCCPIFVGSSFATTFEYVMVTHDLYSISNNEYFENSTALVRLEFYDHIRRQVVNDWSSPQNTIIELAPGEFIPDGTYYYEIKDWSVEFYGDAAFLGQYSGTGGSFNWSIFDLGYGPDWLDESAYLGSYPDYSGQFPGFWFYAYNYTDPSAGDYLKIQRSFGASGSYNTDVGQVGLGGEFNPVPEPSSILLLSTGLFGLAGYCRKKLGKK